MDETSDQVMEPKELEQDGSPEPVHQPAPLQACDAGEQVPELPGAASREEESHVNHDGVENSQTEDLHIDVESPPEFAEPPPPPGTLGGIMQLLRSDSPSDVKKGLQDLVSHSRNHCAIMMSDNLAVPRVVELLKKHSLETGTGNLVLQALTIIALHPDGRQAVAINGGTQLLCQSFKQLPEGHRLKAAILQALANLILDPANLAAFKAEISLQDLLGCLNDIKSTLAEAAMAALFNLSSADEAAHEDLKNEVCMKLLVGMLAHAGTLVAQRIVVLLKALATVDKRVVGMVIDLADELKVPNPMEGF